MVKYIPRITLQAKRLISFTKQFTAVLNLHFLKKVLLYHFPPAFLGIKKKQCCSYTLGTRGYAFGQTLAVIQEVSSENMDLTLEITQTLKFTPCIKKSSTDSTHFIFT
jgi:hypothetical protein